MAYTIWVTGACNLKCKYCYEGKEKSQKNMTKEIAEATINFIMKLMLKAKRLEHRR